MNVFTFLLVVSKRLELQKPDWTHSEDIWMKINLFFLKICGSGAKREIPARERSKGQQF